MVNKKLKPLALRDHKELQALPGAAPRKLDMP